MINAPSVYKPWLLMFCLVQEIWFKVFEECVSNTNISVNEDIMWSGMKG